jgi:hypothetical protein
MPMWLRWLVIVITAIILIVTALRAQTPIGLGTGTLSPGVLDYFDWYTATASGCTAGTREMCVGTLPNGDTIYPTGWFAEASQLPVTTGLPIVGTLNDFMTKTCAGNVGVIQIAAFSWAARNASKIAEVNCMDTFNSGPGRNAWNMHCTSNDDSPGCVWHSRSSFVRGGRWYLPVIRQIPAGTASVHDATLIVSADGGKTWKNPYTVAHGGAASATGDAPLCDSAAGGAGNPCRDARYAGSIMWPGLPGNLITWQAIQYGQDWGTADPSTAMPSGINDGCDPMIYTCFISDPIERSLARVLNRDLPSLDVTKWQYYTCPAITDAYRCPGSAAGSWTSVFADRTPIGPPIVNFIWSNPVTYIKEFKSYLMTGGLKSGGSANVVFYTSPAPYGPWEVFANPSGLSWGFTVPVLALSTTVGTNPPRVSLTTVSDVTTYTAEGSPIFAQLDLVPERTPMTQGGEQSLYRKIGTFSFNAGYILSDRDALGTIPRKDIVWLFDFYDHGGTSGWEQVTTGFRDLANGSAFLVPCLGNPTGTCQWNAGQGVTLQPYGANLQDNGYKVHLITASHETPQTIAIGAANSATAGLTPQNVPSTLQGNGSYTIAGVFRINGTGYNQVPLWLIGDASGSNTEVALSYPNTTGGPLELGWGVSANRWRYLSAFTPTTGNWYFVACTVQANGATPTGHMWMGIGGSLVDEIAGVSRASTGGRPTQTPNVAAAPLQLGIEPGGTHHTNASYASLFVYSRALSQAEVWLMYNTVKAKMAARGVTLQ